MIGKVKVTSTGHLIRFGKDLWTSIILRKPTTCRLCPQKLDAGREAYRPLTNSRLRGERICPTCAAKIFDQAEGAANRPL